MFTIDSPDVVIERTKFNLLVHFFVVSGVGSRQFRGGGVSGDEGGLLLRHASFALLDGQALRGPTLHLDVLVRLLCPQGIGADGGVSIAVHRLNSIGGDSMLHELAELLLVRLFVIFKEALHIFGDMLAKDVFLVDFGVVLFALGVKSGESPVAVGDVDASVNGALEGAEDLGSGGSTSQADVEVSAEGAVFSVDVLNAEILAVGLRLALVNLVQTELGKNSPGYQETRAVGGGVVRQPDLDAVFGEFVSVSGLNDHVSVNTGVRYLTDDVLVGKSDDQSVLGSVVLVLILADKTTSGEVIGLSTATALVLDLKPLEVGLVLDNLDESHDSFGYGANGTRQSQTSTGTLLYKLI